MKLCMFFEKYKFYVGKLFEKMKELRKSQKMNTILPMFYIIFNEKLKVILIFLIFYDKTAQLFNFYPF